jgi:hypothetical protein
VGKLQALARAEGGADENGESILWNQEAVMTKFYWHVHHDLLLEPLTEPLENRIEYVRKYKPKEQLETRLKWLAPVKGKLPKALIETGKAYKKAWEACKKACDVNRAWATYEKAWFKHKPELEALHAKEHPGCPWDGKTLL